MVRDPFLIFGSQTGSDLGWCLLVPLRDGLGRSGPLLAEDLVDGRGAGGERGPDLLAVGGLGDGCAAAAVVIRSRIESGEYPSGAPLPSAKAMVQGYGISVGAATRAVDVIRGRPCTHGAGRGVWVIPRS